MALGTAVGNAENGGGGGPREGPGDGVRECVERRGRLPNPEPPLGV